MLALRPLARHGLALRSLPLAAARSWAAAGAQQQQRQQQQQQQQQQQPCRAASGGGGDSDGAAARQQIAPPDVRELARMAHIDITDEEVADWGPKIEGIVEWFGQLQEVDVEGVPPALRADVEGEGALRADVPQQFEGQAGMLSQAPDRNGLFVRVPKIATGADD